MSTQAKKPAKLRRQAIVEEVRRKDEAKHVSRPNRPAIERWPEKIVTQPRKRTPTGLCCIERHNGDMPNYFRRCPDCPADKE